MSFIMPQYRKSTASPSAHEVDIRISEMGWLELRGLSQDYRDMCKRVGIPARGGFRFWLHNRIADQLIAKQYDDERSWF